MCTQQGRSEPGGQITPLTELRQLGRNFGPQWVLLPAQSMSYSPGRDSQIALAKRDAVFDSFRARFVSGHDFSHAASSRAPSPASAAAPCSQRLKAHLPGGSIGTAEAMPRYGASRSIFPFQKGQDVSGPRPDAQTNNAADITYLRSIIRSRARWQFHCRPPRLLPSRSAVFSSALAWARLPVRA